MTTSEAEVTSIDPFGLWILVRGKEYFLPYKEYPWFRGATIDDVLAVELLRMNHLHWPALDVDLCVESLEHPEDFPLIYRNRTAPSRRDRQRAARRLARKPCNR